MLEVFHWIVRDWAVMRAKKSICIVPRIINNLEACRPLGKEMNSTWPFEHFLPLGKTWWSYWKQIPDCIISLHHHDSRTFNSWGQDIALFLLPEQWDKCYVCRPRDELDKLGPGVSLHWVSHQLRTNAAPALRFVGPGQCGHGCLQ